MRRKLYMTFEEFSAIENFLLNQVKITYWHQAACLVAILICILGAYIGILAEWWLTNLAGYINFFLVIINSLLFIEVFDIRKRLKERHQELCENYLAGQI